MSADVKEEEEENAPQADLSNQLQPGDLVAGRFRIVERLAEGGMGIVYVATQEPMGRKVALKVMKQELVSDQASVKRFYREAVAVSRLHHPNTITIIDYGEAEGNKLFLAMEFLDGQPLSKILETEERLPLKRAVNIVGQVTRALAEAHERGVIHRDLKPDNVFISTVDGGEDFVKVLDFGIAKLQEGSDGVTKITRLGYVCGTPEYMAPEQARGEDLDGRTDLYALSVMLYELLEGETPYDAPTPLGIVLKHQTAPVPELTVQLPNTVKQFIYRGMSKDKAGRPASAEAFLDELLAACPADLETYSTAAAGSRSTSRRGAVVPMTPDGPMHNTNEMAFAATAPDAPAAAAIAAADALDYVDMSAPEPRSRSGLFVGVGVALLLLALAGVAVAIVAGDDDTSDATPVADSTPLTPVATTASLIVTGQPPGAEIFRDGTLVGHAPLDISGEPEGAVEIEVRADGYAPVKLERTFPKSGKMELAYALSTVEPEKVVVTLDSDPPGARIKQGEVVLGMTPFSFQLAASDPPLDVALELADHDTAMARVDPSQGARTVKIPLVPRKRVARPSNGVARKDGGSKAGGDKAGSATPPVGNSVPPPKDPKDKYKIVH